MPSSVVVSTGVADGGGEVGNNVAAQTKSAVLSLDNTIK